MKYFKLRVLALLLALVMTLGTTGALAQSQVPADPTLAYLENGGVLRTEASINLNPQMAMMIAGLTGKQMDEATSSGLALITNVLNKLRLDMLSSMTHASGVVGTQQGELFNFQASFDPKTSDNQISTNLLPGMLLKVAPEMMSSFSMDAMPQVDPSALMQISGPYVAALNSFGEEISAKSTHEQGTFDFPAYGSFANKTDITVTSHQVAGLLSKLAEVYKNDPASQQFVQGILEQSAKGNPTVKEDTQALDPASLADEVTKTAASIIKEADFPVFKGALYQGENGNYIDGIVPGAESQIKLDLFASTHNSDKGEMAMTGRVIVPGKNDDGTDTVIESWDAEEEAITGGQRFTSVMVKFNLASKPQDNAKNVAARFDIFAMGMNFGLNIEGQSQNDKIESTSKIELFVMSPEPMATVNIKMSQSDETPVAPLTQGATMVTLSENEVDQEQEQLLGASLQKGLSDLVERLKVALPEEAPALLQLLESSMPQIPGEQAPEAAPAAGK